MKTSVLLVSTGASLLAVHAAFAQGVASPPAAVDEVVVTAQRFGSGLTRAAETLDRQDIEERPFGADIMQSLNKVPGVVVSTGDARGGSFSFEMSMRGLTDQQIGLTLDGVPTGDARFNGGSPPQRFIDSSNIAKITVSQSAGDIGAPSRFALGGFIDFVSDDPRPTFGGTVEAGYGSFDYGREFIRIDTGEISKGLTAYASYSHQYNDIWAGQDSRHDERDHYEVKVRQAFDNGSSIQARVSYNKQFDNDFNIVTLPQFLSNPRSDQATDVLSGKPAVDVNYGGALGGTRKDLLAYVNGDFVLSDTWRLKVSPYAQTLRGESYRYQDRQRILAGGDPRAVLSYDATGAAVRPALTTLLNNNVVGGPADMRVTPRDRDRYGVTTELAAHDLWGGQSFRFGGWYEHSQSNEDRDFYPIINSAQSIAFDRSKLNYVQYARSVELQSIQLYAQDEIKALDDRLTVDLGATWYDLTYDAKSPLEYNAVLSFSQRSKLNPKIGFNYKLADATEVFGGYAQNFSGIPEDAFLGSTAVIDLKEIKPSTTDNLDLGLRYVKPNFAVSIQGFYVDLHNNVGIIPRDSTVGVDPGEILRGNVATKAANTEGQKDRGVDVTAYYKTGPVELYGAYTYQDARHDNPPMGSPARKALEAVEIIGGARVRDIPLHALFAEASVTPTAHSKISLNVRYVADRVGAHIIAATGGTELGVEKIPDYSLLGLSAYYDLPSAWGMDLRLQLNVDNLLDKAYLASVSESTASQPELGASIANPAGRTLTRYFVGAPRTVTLSLRGRF